MHIVFCSSEVVPFAKTGGLADVCGVLPHELASLGHEISIVLPKYKFIDDQYTQTNPYVFDNGVKVYFIENDKYFKRNGLYGTPEGDYKDNLKRFTNFCRNAIKLINSFKSPVEIIHCHDWQTALIPVILKAERKAYQKLQNTRTVLTIHNLAYQGVFPSSQFNELKLDEKLFNHESFEFYGQLNLLKAGIVYADVVTTVSPRYAKEILTQEYGCGLEGVIQYRKTPVVGILNGLDYHYWNPSQDPHLSDSYDYDSCSLKNQNKTELQRDLGLPEKDVPVFGFISRLSHQKGIDLIDEVLEDLLKLDAQFIFLGVGEKKYESFLSAQAKKNPTKLAAHLTFDEPMAHRVYGASDFFLMPSVYEPCGLTQMIALRYGVVPIVFNTGGLADTITDIKNKNGNGIVFDQHEPNCFTKAIKRAVKLFKDKKEFNKVQQRAFKERFTWDESAKHYLEMYTQ